MSSSFLAGLEVAASGLGAQRTRLNVISSNLANAQTTRTDEGGPYLRQEAIFESVTVDRFGEALQTANDAQAQGVRVRGVNRDTQTPTELIYDPGHPDANPNGYVEMPNVNVLEEMVDMITASRSYEANATSFETLKSMAMRALQIGG